MHHRLAIRSPIGLICGVITVALWSIERRDLSIWLGILLFVVASFALQQESFAASLAFAAIATTFLPAAALFAKYDFTGGLDPFHRVDSLIAGLVVATVVHGSMRRIHGL